MSLHIVWSIRNVRQFARFGGSPGEGDQVQFCEASAPTPGDLATVQQVRTRVLRWFARAGPLEPADACAGDEGDDAHFTSLIPPPRLHRRRYHGVLTPNSPQRAQLIALARAPILPPSAPDPANSSPAPGCSPAHYLWAVCLARIYEFLSRHHDAAQFTAPTRVSRRVPQFPEADPTRRLEPPPHTWYGWTSSPSDTTIAAAMWDAFISHASQDMAAALRFERSLSAEGLSAWVDHDNIRGGGLLIPTLQTALQESRNIVVLWSSAAAASPWVTTEWTSVVNLNHQKETSVQKGVIPCRVDDTPLALFLLNYVFCDFRTSFEAGTASLVTALRGEIEQTPPPARYQPSDFVQQIIAGQDSVLTALGSNDPATALKLEGQLNRLVDTALREQPGDPYLLALAGYNKKNQYVIRHWDALQAGLPPRDVLLDEAAELFFKVLSTRPEDPSALNGLGSVFMLRGDLDAAEFYIKRSLVRAREEGFDYPAADQDLRLIQYLKKPQRRGRRPRRARSPDKR